MSRADKEDFNKKLSELQGFIEEKDASAEQKKINEVFTGIMIIKGEMLLSSLDEVNNNNAAGEYY